MTPRQRGLPLVLILSATSIIYGNIFSVPFVFDGKEVIQDALAFKDFFPIVSPEKILRPRSIVDASFAFNYRWGHLNVFGYQLFNVMVHAMNGTLVYFLSLLIFTRFSHTFSSPAVSLFTALVFVSHPVQTQAVTYAIQRYTSVATLFYMMSVFFYLRARMASRLGHGPGVSAMYLGAVLCGVAAFLSKQNTVTLPLAILLAEFLVVEKTASGWRKNIPWILLFLGSWSFCISYVFWMGMGGEGEKGWLDVVSSRMSEIEGVDRWSYLCTQFNVVTIYIKLLLFPFQQNIDYMYPFKRGFWDGNTPIAFLFLSGVVGWGITSMKKSPLSAFGIFWFFTALAVESSIIPIRDPLFEHRLYLPMLGFALFLSWKLFGLSARNFRFTLTMSALVVFLLGLGANMRNEIWAHPMKLWSDSVLKNPKNFRGHNNLGSLLIAEDQLPEAMDHFKTAAEIIPEFPEAHYNMGLVYGKMGRPQEALGRLKMAERLGMRSFDLYHHLGFYYGKSELWGQAVEEYLLALKLKPDSPQVHSDLCVAYLQLDRYRDAIKECKKSIDLNPVFYQAYSNLGNVYFVLKRYSEALREYHLALRLNPGLREARYYLGLAYFYQGRFDEAEKEWTSVLDLYPGYDDAARALMALKRTGGE